MGGCTWLLHGADAEWDVQEPPAVTPVPGAKKPWPPLPGRRRWPTVPQQAQRGGSEQDPRDEADFTGSGPFVLWPHPCSPPADACLHFHWVQRWGREPPAAARISLVLLVPARDDRLRRTDRPVLAGTLGPSYAALPRETPARRRCCCWSRSSAWRVIRWWPRAYLGQQKAGRASTPRAK